MCPLFHLLYNSAITVGVSPTLSLTQTLDALSLYRYAILFLNDMFWDALCNFLPFPRK